MYKQLCLFASVLTSVVLGSVSVNAEIIPFQDGKIPEKQVGTFHLFPIQQYQSTFYIEGVALEYTANRAYMVTRFKAPKCEGGNLNASLFTKFVSKNGILTSEPYFVTKQKEGTMIETTFSYPAYFGELKEGGIEMFTKSNCSLQPTQSVTPIVPDIQPNDKPLNVAPPVVDKFKQAIGEEKKKQFDDILQKNKPNAKQNIFTPKPRVNEPLPVIKNNSVKLQSQPVNEVPMLNDYDINSVEYELYELQLKYQ
jgi:hypothetical protein